MEKKEMIMIADIEFCTAEQKATIIDTLDELPIKYVYYEGTE